MDEPRQRDLLAWSYPYALVETAGLDMPASYTVRIPDCPDMPSSNIYALFLAPAKQRQEERTVSFLVFLRVSAFLLLYIISCRLGIKGSILAHLLDTSVNKVFRHRATTTSI